MARFDLDAELAQTDKLLGLPAGLSRAQIQVESGFNPRAVSPAGAMGLAQVMPATLKTLSQRLGRDLDPYSPQDAVQIQREVLRENLAKFRDPAKALMAYNGGWDPAKWNNPETQAYVGKIQSALRGGGSVMAQAADKVMSTVSGTANAATVDLSAKVKQAKDAGYSDDEIFQHLSQSQGFADKLKQAKDAGYSDAEIRRHFGLGAAVPQQPKASAAPAEQKKPEEPGTLASFSANAGKGFGSAVLGAQQLIGKGLQTIGADAVGGWLVKDATEGARRLEAQAKPYAEAHPVAAVAGELTGALANPINRLVPLAGGGLASTALRAGAQGAISGAVTPVTEEGDFAKNKLAQVAMGAGVGSALPVAGAAVTGAGRYIGRTARSLVEPFTENGQNRIAGNILQRFAQGGPVAGNADELIAGSRPTLAQATGNPGLATLERGIQSGTPQGANAFAERAAANSQARGAALEGTIGSNADLLAAKAERAANAADDYLSTNIGIPVSNTEYAALKETPAFRAAMARAQAMARNAGTSVETQVQNRANANLGGAANKPETYVSGQGLQTIKEALDDQINTAARAGKSKQAANLLGVKERLLSLMDREIPGYGDARAAYEEASRPIDAMKFLQDLRLTDAQGNVTLAKVQNALRKIQTQQGLPGVREAKSVSPEQVEFLTSLRDDLLRAANSGAGKSTGSNTFQNLATNNILENALPGPVRALMGGTSGPVGTLAGRVGNLVYGGANESIQNRLLDMMMNPQSGLAALQNVGGNQLTGPLGGNALLQRLAPNLLPAGAIGANMLARPNSQ